MNQFAKYTIEFIEVPSFERVNEVVPNALFVFWPYLIESLTAFLGERHIEPATIMCVQQSVNQAVVLHSIEYPSEATAAQRLP